VETIWSPNACAGHSEPRPSAGARDVIAPATCAPAGIDWRRRWLHLFSDAWPMRMSGSHREQPAPLGDREAQD